MKTVNIVSVIQTKKSSSEKKQTLSKGTVLFLINIYGLMVH